MLYLYLFPWFIYPLNNMSFCASIFITVAMAFERWTAVCRPLHYWDVTTRHSVRRRTLRCVHKAPQMVSREFCMHNEALALGAATTAANGMTRDLFIFSYVIPVLLASVVLNIPKFFESHLTWVPRPNSTSENATNEDELLLTVTASDLRSDPDFIRYYIHWLQLLSTGLLPMAALVFFSLTCSLGMGLSSCCRSMDSWDVPSSSWRSCGCS